MGQVSGRHKLSTAQVRHLQRQVSFSESEIKEWYQEFCYSIGNRQGDLYLSEEEFVRVYNSVYPGQSDDFARHVFRTFDLDGNNKVDFREFLMGLSLSGSADMHKQLSWAFRLYDVTRSGYITKGSMVEIIRAVFKMIGSWSLRHNDVTETPETLADDLFNDMDKDGDQRVTWQEFCDGASRNSTVLRLLQCSPPE